MIKHECISIAGLFNFVFNHAAKVIEGGGFGLCGCRVWVWFAPIGAFEGYPGFADFGVEIASPIPCGDGHVGFCTGNVNTHLFGAAPCCGTDIAIFKVVGLHDFGLGGLDLIDAIGHFHMDDIGGFQQAFGVFARFKDGAVIGAFALEHLRAVMQGMGEVVDFGFAPGQHFAVHPNITVSIIERNHNRSSIHLDVVIRSSRMYLYASIAHA